MTLLGRNRFARLDIASDRNDHFRTNHTGANLGGAVDAGHLSDFGLEQIKRLLRHHDFAEALGKHERHAEIFRTGDRHADIVTEEIAQVFVRKTAGDNAGWRRP